MAKHVIAEYREARRMTQQDLAQAIGVARSTVANYENNHAVPSYQILMRLAAVLKVPVYRLLARMVPEEVSPGVEESADADSPFTRYGELLREQSERIRTHNHALMERLRALQEAHTLRRTAADSGAEESTS